MKKLIYLFSVFLLMSCGLFATNNQTPYDLDELDISLEELDKLEAEQSLSFSQKIELLFAIISLQASLAKKWSAEKLEVAKDHVLEHHKAYALGTAAAVSIIIWLNRDRIFSTSTVTI